MLRDAPYGLLNGMTMGSIEETLLNGRLGKEIARVVRKPESLRFRLARDTLGVMALQGGSMSLGFLISVLLFRTLGVKEFGLYSFAWSFLALLSTPTAFVFPQPLVRENTTNRAKGEWGAFTGSDAFPDVPPSWSLWAGAVGRASLGCYGDKIHFRCSDEE